MLSVYMEILTGFITVTNWQQSAACRVLLARGRVMKISKSVNVNFAILSTLVLPIFDDFCNHNI